MAKIATRLNITPANFSAMMRRDLVRLSTRLEVSALFDELWDQEPPHDTRHDKAAYSRALAFAKARRWLPALAWDDPDTDVEPPTIEDGDATVDEVAVDLALAGERPRLTPAERREYVRRAHALRWTINRTATTIGCDYNTVSRICVELALPTFDHTELVNRGAAA